MSEILKKIEFSYKRYAVVGIPCFIKSLRNLCENNSKYNLKIKYFIGIVCGHLKSKHFASLFAWQYNIHPDKLINIDFRYKKPASSASLYSVKLTYKEDNEIKELITTPASELYGTDWGSGFFKYKACDYCDDVLAELSDVVFGDAWASKYWKDWRGHNLIVVRNNTINQLLDEANKNNILNLDEVNEDIVYQSQGGSFRHRRKGLEYRLFRLEQNKLWKPKKRVTANNNFDNKYKRIQDFRIMFQQDVDILFLEAIKKNDFNYFINKLRFKIIRYKFLVYGISRGIIPSRFKNIYRHLKPLQKVIGY